MSRIVQVIASGVIDIVYTNIFLVSLFFAAIKIGTILQELSIATKSFKYMCNSVFSFYSLTLRYNFYFLCCEVKATLKIPVN